MWSSTAASRGAALMRIAGSAMRSCRQGSGPREAHPPRLARAPASSSSSARRLGEQLLNLRLIFILSVVEKPDMFEADTSAAVDEHGAGHTRDLERRGNGAPGVVDDRKAGGCIVQELLGELIALVQIDADDDQIPLAVLTHEVVQPRKGASARGAPGGPEVEIDHLAPIGTEIQSFCTSWAAGHEGQGNAQCTPRCLLHHSPLPVLTVFRGRCDRRRSFPKKLCAAGEVILLSRASTLWLVS